MKATVDEETCVGCSLCSDMCPSVFQMDEGVAKVFIDEVPEDDEDECREAAKGCPVEAITVEE